MSVTYDLYKVRRSHAYSSGQALSDDISVDQSVIFGNGLPHYGMLFHKYTLLLNTVAAYYTNFCMWFLCESTLCVLNVLQQLRGIQSMSRCSLVVAQTALSCSGRPGMYPFNTVTSNYIGRSENQQIDNEGGTMGLIAS